MDSVNAPQIIEHQSMQLDFTPYDTKWIPGTARFVLAGQTMKATGIMKVFKLNQEQCELELSVGGPDQVSEGQGVKSMSFGASPFGGQSLAIGDFSGELRIHDLEKNKVSWRVKAHQQIVNSVDAIGGLDVGFGAPEILTGSRDGSVKLWDPRQNTPVLVLEPTTAESEVKPDCWTVGFGNSYNDGERVIAAGYDNGDLKMFDLKTNSLL
jgi:WD40 repeat protein